MFGNTTFRGVRVNPYVVIFLPKRRIGSRGIARCAFFRVHLASQARSGYISIGMDHLSMKNSATIKENAIKLAGELFIPGASLLMEGKILPGSAHLITGLVLRSLVGPIGYGVVIANSYASSVTGKNLLNQFSKPKPVEAAAEKTTDEVVETIPVA